MNRDNELKILTSGTKDQSEFYFDMMDGPAIYNLLTFEEIQSITSIVKDKKLSSRPDNKIKMIDSVMKRRHIFNRLGSGTNRLVYRTLNDQSFVIKIGIDSIGIEANLLEYEAQSKLKPFVAKTYYSDGVFAVSERVTPFKTLAQFEEVAPYVYDILNNITGKYVIEDVGSNFFANWGVRENFGPVLLDYPYVYSINEDSLYCTSKDSITEAPCGGIIDYDENYNYLLCVRCKKRYYAKEIASVENKNIIFNGGGIIPMEVRIVKNGKVICDPMMHSNKIVNKAKEEKKNVANVLNVVVKKNGVPLTTKKSQEEVVREPENEVVDTTVEVEEETGDEEFNSVVENEDEEETSDSEEYEDDDDSEESEKEVPSDPIVVKPQQAYQKPKVKSEMEKRCDEIDRNLSKGIFHYNDDGDIVDKKGRKIKLPEIYYTREDD